MISGHDTSLILAVVVAAALVFFSDDIKVKAESYFPMLYSMGNRTFYAVLVIAYFVAIYLFSRFTA